MADPIAPASAPRKTRCEALEDEALLPRKEGAGDQDLVDAIACKNREVFDLTGGYDYANEVFTGAFSHSNTLKGFNYGLEGAFKLDGPAGGVRFHMGATAPLSDKLSFTLNGGTGIGAQKAGDVVRLGLDANLDAKLSYFMNQQNTFFLAGGLQGRLSFYVDIAEAERAAVKAEPRFETLKQEVDAAVEQFKTEVRAAFANSQGLIDQIMSEVSNQINPVATALPGALLSALLSGGNTSAVTALITGATNTIETRVGNLAGQAGQQALQALTAAIDKLKRNVLASLGDAGRDMADSISNVGSVGGGLSWAAEAGWRGRFAVRGTEPELGNWGGGIYVEPSASIFASGPIAHFGIDSPTLPNDPSVFHTQVGLAAGFRVSFEIPKSTVGVYLEQSFRAPLDVKETTVGTKTETTVELGTPSAQATGGVKLTF